MNKLFLPRTLRFHLSPYVRKLFLICGIMLVCAGVSLSIVTVIQRRAVENIQLLGNREMLMLRVAAKRDVEKREEFTQKQMQLSADYINERRKHKKLFTGSLFLLLSGSVVLKVRKNLSRK